MMMTKGDEQCSVSASPDTNSMLQSATKAHAEDQGSSLQTSAGGDTDSWGDDDDDDGWSDDDGDDGSDEYTCEEMKQMMGESYDEGPCAPKIDNSWTKNVPKGMNPIKNVGNDCKKACLREKSDPKASMYGTCDGFCGKGNACCKFNLPDEMNPKECTQVAPEAFMDKHGDLKQMWTRCTWPKEGSPSNYKKFKDDAWKEAIEIIGGKVPEKMSTLAAPDVDLTGYTKKVGKAEALAYLALGKLPADFASKCPAFGNAKYKLANKGMFPDMTYYKYAYYTKFPDLKIDHFCGARYTDDPSVETAKNAANVAKKACDDMGSKCGGFAVGTDPECCSSKKPGEPGAGCTEVVFLNPSAKTANIDKKPCSFKSCTWQTNFVTFIKA